jgi:hypothetical protein
MYVDPDVLRKPKRRYLKAERNEELIQLQNPAIYYPWSAISPKINDSDR